MTDRYLLASTVLVLFLLSGCVTEPAGLPPPEQTEKVDIPVEVEELKQEPEIVQQEAPEEGQVAEDTQVVLEVTKPEKDISSVIVFGDSLSEGFGLGDPSTTTWAYLVAENYDADLHNYAKSTEPTQHVIDVQLPAFKDDLQSIEGEKLIFLWIGANDILRYVELGVFSSNIDTIIGQLDEIEDGSLVVFTIPDASKLSVAEDIEQGINDFIQDLGIQGSIDVKAIGKEVIRSYNLEIMRVAQEYDVPAIDMFTYLESFDDGLLTEDRFHPNEQGHEMLKEKVIEDLADLYPLVEFS